MAIPFRVAHDKKRIKMSTKKYDMLHFEIQKNDHENRGLDLRLKHDHHDSDLIELW